jgi:hypothetical protein
MNSTEHQTTGSILQILSFALAWLIIEYMADEIKSATANFRRSHEA